MDEVQAHPLPVPLDEFDREEVDDRRLWIGNLDPRITEFTLLKIVQKYGKLEKFDFLYEKTGRDQNKPRGYCFVTYETREASQKAVKALNGKLALQRRLIVRWAHAAKEEPAQKSKIHILGSNLGSTSQDDASTQSKISAIEAKLKVMEKTQNDFTLSTKPVGSLKKEEQTENRTVRQGAKPYTKNNSRR